ncbi:MAG TPA: hypothetical protein VNW25_00060 [Candidatus Sulfotelmatobacter sp.]|jgi:hypothetical protein|nr:hypothetical protein [Candidatus Sulfotelmatobacter sp.]
MNPFLKAKLEQVELDNREKETWIHSSYDTLYGFLCSVPDAYARAKLIRHLDNLYETSLQTIPDSTSESAETVDVKQNQTPSNVSTASSTTPSGSSTGASSRDPSYSPGDEDTGHR